MASTQPKRKSTKSKKGRASQPKRARRDTQEARLGAAEARQPAEALAVYSAAVKRRAESFGERQGHGPNFHTSNPHARGSSVRQRGPKRQSPV